jgi:hypothetical protein
MKIREMTPAEKITDPELRALAHEAQQFITGFKWCRRLTTTRLAWGCPGVLAVFQCKIEPTRKNVDSTLWVVVGDIPPAYLVCEGNRTWKMALEGYVMEMRKWIDAVRSGENLKRIIPVNVSPTTEHAEMLESRLNCIETKILKKKPTRPCMRRRDPRRA